MRVTVFWAKVVKVTCMINRSLLMMISLKALMKLWEGNQLIIHYYMYLVLLFM